MKKFLMLLALLPNFCFAACNMNIPFVNIGLYNPLSSNYTQSSSYIGVNCDAPQNVTVKLSAGSSNNISNRTLVSARGDVLNYNVFLDAARSNIFGNGAGTSYYGGQNGNIPFFIVIPAKQVVRSGTYADNLLIELNF